MAMRSFASCSQDILSFASRLSLDDLEALAFFACLDRLRFSQYSESSGLVASKTALASGVEVIILNKLSRY